MLATVIRNPSSTPLLPLLPPPPPPPYSPVTVIIIYTPSSYVASFPSQCLISSYTSYSSSSSSSSSFSTFSSSSTSSSSYFLQHCSSTSYKSVPFTFS